eukprot:g22338.t1
MVKGLVAGIRTLALAFSLLFCVLYVISGFATMTLGTYETTKDMGLDKYFETLPITMFTCFRCFSTGECTDEDGEPLPQKLAEKYGVIFVLSYVASYMLVAMGIHNVILAVYVEITMKAAKENEAVTAEQWARESIRIARVTRELLKRFASAYRLFHDLDDLRSNLSGLDISPEGALFTDDDVHEGIAITKDLFLLIIDADGSGTLQIAELVQGLLKIRGEINKSDAVAALLVSQSVQNLVVEMKTEFSQTLAELKEAGNRNLLTLWTHIERLSSSPGTCAELPPACQLSKSTSQVWQHVMEGAALPEHRDWENLRKDQLPSALLQLLKTGFTHCSSKVLEFFPADQGGGKMLLELQDGQRIETVLIEHAGPKPRSTVCVSSSEAPVRNVVFMGMGEPLDNYENVIAAVKVMPEHAFGLALKNVTISTVGVMGRIRALGSEFPFAGPNLALSLHAPTQERARSVTL